MDSLNVIIYILILIMIFFFSLVLRKKTKGSCFNGLLFGMFLYYILVPIISLINIGRIEKYENGLGFFNVDTIDRLMINIPMSSYFYSFLVILISFICYIFFYNISKKNNTKLTRNKTSVNFVKYLMYFLMILGSVSLIIFFYKFGGIKSALSYAEYMRSFSNNASEGMGRFRILIIPARFITVVPFLLLYLKNEKCISNKKHLFLFIFSFILSILFYLYNAGRAPLISFILCFAYPIVKKKIKHTWLFLIVLGFISIPLLDILDSLFVYLNTGVFNLPKIVLEKYIFEFLYPFKNILNLLKMRNVFGYSYFKSFITSIISLIPGINFTASYENTSLFVNGVNWKIIGGIPNDLITFSHIQLGIIGIIIIFSVLGYISQKIDYRVKNIENNNIKYLFSGILTVYSFLLVGNADFVSFIRGNMILYITVFTIFLMFRKEKNK